MHIFVILIISYSQIKCQRPPMDEVCKDVLDQEECKNFKEQGMCQKNNDNVDFCKSTCELCGTPVLLLSLFSTGYRM